MSALRVWGTKNDKESLLFACVSESGWREAKKTAWANGYSISKVVRLGGYWNSFRNEDVTEELMEV